MNATNKNIILTGFMGTGKSTVGPIVAEKLGRVFIETDKEIEKAVGKSIPQIFAEDGEAAFRQLERNLCQTLASQQHLVIATGGGMVVDDDNRRLMLDSGFVVCLSADDDTLQARLSKSEERPLAHNWQEVLERRRPVYNSIPHQVEVTGKSPTAIADEIIALWRLYQGDTLWVQSPDGAYPIIIQPQLLAQLDALAHPLKLDGHVVVITNETLAPLYGEAMVRRLSKAHLLWMPDGEQYKTLEIVGRLYRDLVAVGADRNTTIIALGGGVVGDTVGFVAATYMRGLRFIQIPTSLLAMVDSSVGGKVGVDLPEGKNLVGAFKQPNAVLIDPEALKTLPLEQWRCGMAEVLKHGLLADAELLNPAFHTPNRAAELVRRAVKVKIDIVEQDPYERSIRAHLNLGHTFAHAIEQASGFAWSHGEAVGVGLLAAAMLSRELQLCDEALVGRIDDLLASVGLPRRIRGLAPETIYTAMATDKKWKQGRSRFILLRGIGQPVIVEGIERQTVIKVLAQLSSSEGGGQ